MKKIIFLLSLFFIFTNAFGDTSTYTKGPQLVESNKKIVSSAEIETLTATSPMNIYISGTNTHTVKLPSSASIAEGFSYKVFNKSTQAVSVVDSSSVPVSTISPNTDKSFMLFNGGLWAEGAGGSTGKTLVAGNGISINQDATTATFTLGTVDYLDFNTSATHTHVDGRLHWDSVNKTLAFDVDAANGVEGQINEELWVEATNNTGAPILDGQVVYINGALSGFPTIALADSTNYNKTIGVATQNIATGDVGKVTTKGTVGGFNTSGYAAGDILYLSPTVAGSLTATRPASNIVQVAKVLNSQASGKILIDVLPPTDDQTLDPTGFLNPHLTTVTYDQATRKVTLSGTVNALWKGQHVTQLVNGWVSEAHSSTPAKYYLYYNGSSFVWSTTPWAFDMLMIASVDYDGVNNIALRETHGIMNWNSHEEFHRVIGTFLKSGADLSDYKLTSTTPADRRPLVSAAEILDEDLQSTVNAIATESYSLFSLTGTASATYTFASADIVPVVGSKPNYNRWNGSAWIQTPMTNNAYQALFLIAIPTTSDVNSQKYRYLWIQGQTESTTLSTINAITPADINLNGLVTNVAEFVYVAKVVIQYVGPATNDWRITSVSKLTGSRYNQTAFSSSSFLSSVTTDASFTGNGSVASPLALSGTVTTTGYHYYGTDADNSYRVYQSAGALITEKKVSGTWVEVSRLDNL